MIKKILASLMLLLLLSSSVQKAVAGEIVLTRNEPVVMYGERIVMPTTTPWHKKPWIWILFAGIVAMILADDDDDEEAPPTTEPGSLIITGPPL